MHKVFLVNNRYFFDFSFKTWKRNELTMITLPKPKFAKSNVPIGQSIDDYKDEIIVKQAHALKDAIDRVSFRGF